MKFWIKHPRTGEADAMLTLGVYSLVVVLLKFMFSETAFGPVVFGQLDAGVVAAILTPTLGAYAARKYTDSMTSNKNSGDKDEV
jgi:hypothetical protein